MNSFFSWVGGKHLLKKEIIKKFPPHFNKYVEVFGGAAWVLFHKDPSSYEVYNDYDKQLVNLFRIIKYHMPELQRSLKFDLNSRQIFYETNKQYDLEDLTDIQKAKRFFLTIKQSYGSHLQTFGGKKQNINSIIENLELIQKRLQSVIIECRDFEELLKTYDRKNTFFYLDPPYYGTEKYYKIKFSKDDHIRLYNTLSNIKGKFLLSYNDCDCIRNLYKDFKIETLSRKQPLSPNKIKETYRELLILNY